MRFFSLSYILRLIDKITPAEQSRDKFPFKERKRVTTQDDARMKRQELLTKGAKLRKTEMPHKQRSSLTKRITDNYY
ncbi:hypothetical protein PCASD_02848 [Puccinia coronata f. sp. avenae]|uniref:Uncharacterized protein n=1 Tax=Puccinia coronata f. sp. avenae TaxID=200324 RepID=A0A2N5VG00_9BASI|nr:hypothetical protein PCASD_02848 [Puccinia coronata f. sp. avenae]